LSVSGHGEIKVGTTNSRNLYLSPKEALLTEFMQRLNIVRGVHNEDGLGGTTQAELKKGIIDI